MDKINPFVGLFVALATLLTAFFVPVFVLLIDHGERLAALESTVGVLQADIDGVKADIDGVKADIDGVKADIAALARDVAAVEAVQAEHGERLARIDSGISALAGNLTATNERMARMEGTVAGALGRPFPERMAEAPGSPGVGG